MFPTWPGQGNAGACDSTVRSHIVECTVGSPGEDTQIVLAKEGHGDHLDCLAAV